MNWAAIAVATTAFLLGSPTVANSYYYNVTRDWWKSAVIYQIYPRSFMDTDGNGVGDLKGITQKVGYLKDLGVDAVWLSPVYPTANADFGYDITDYTGIDPLFGDMDAFKEMATALKDNGIKLIMDFVPNHSSDEHNWFKNSKKRIEPFTDYYVWMDRKPNNWVSGFGGSAWKFDSERGQFYLHQFLDKQPDLNYTNQVVLQEMKTVLTTWMGHGVDGFRMDAVYTIWENNYHYDEPAKPACYDFNSYGCYDHIYTADQTQTYVVLADFRKVLDDYARSNDNLTRLMMTESYSDDRDKIMRYYGLSKDSPAAHFPFNFDIITKLDRFSTGGDWVRVINSYLEAVEQTLDDMPPRWPNWVMGNHDQTRVATKFGTERVDNLNILLLLLKGTAVTYNGEELGMENSLVRRDQAKDPQGLANFPQGSRDPQRGPMLWNDSVNAGFTKGDPWLPVQAGYWHNNYKKQNATANSHVNIYKRMVKLRQTYILKYGTCHVEALSDNVILVVRALEDNPSVIGLINMGYESEIVNLLEMRPTLPDRLYVYATSGTVDTKLSGKALNTTEIVVSPMEALVMITEELSVPLKIDEKHTIIPKDHIAK